MAHQNKKLLVESYLINGVIQYYSVNVSDSPELKPVVLFLHGGPGSANMSLLNQICPVIETHATVVNWDQRGAGKSFDLFASTDKLTIEQLISDAHELTQVLKRKYKKDRITLMGFSWGSALGLMLSNRYPQDYQCFISIAQLVNGIQGESLSLDLVRKEAQSRNDSRAIKSLKHIVYDFNNPRRLISQILIERKYLLKYGGVYVSKTSYGHEATSLLRSREYSYLDFFMWPIASTKSLKKMWPEIIQLDFFSSVPSLTIPVVFITGKYDMNHPTSLVQEYYAVLEAPKGKELIVFNHSAHAVFWDEPERFGREIIAALSRYPN